MGDISVEKVDALFKGLKKNFRDQLGADTQQTSDAYCTTIESDGVAEDYDWLGAFPDLREWVGGRVLNDLSSSLYTLRNKKFEDTMRISLDHIRNDKVGHYSTRAKLLATAAKRWKEGLVVKAITDNGICADGQNFFDTDHVHGKSETAFSNDNPDLTSFGGGTGDTGTSFYMMDTSQVIQPIIFQSREAPVFEQLGLGSDHAFMKDEVLAGVRAQGAAGYSFWQLAMKLRSVDATVAGYRAQILAARNAGASLKNEFDQKMGVRYDTILCDQASEVVIKQAVNSLYVDSSFTLNPIANSFKIIVVNRL